MRKSISGKIIVLVSASMLAVVALLLLLIIPKVSKSMSGVTQNYMLDMAKLAGHEIDSQIIANGVKITLADKALGSIVGDVKIEGMDTSYTYVVQSDAVMLYHPTPEKIGQPVENAAVKQIVAELNNGNKMEPGVIEYEFKGKMKYAAFYIGIYNSYIVIVTADKSDVMRDIQTMTIFSICGSLAICIVFVVISVFISNKITSPIKLLDNEIRKLSNLNFTTNPGLEKLTRSKDETGAISASVINLEKQLQEATVRLKELTEQLFLSAEAMGKNASNTVSSVGQVEKATEEIAQGAASQAEETQTATENVVIMGDMVEETANEVGMLRANAENMERAGKEALDIFVELNATNDRTRKSVEMVYEQTNVTNASVSEIKTAIDMITEIAEQTNLLSLNASIEAARAGEMGRGFAVVASEIQKLAEQSNNSARQIGDVIGRITEESAKSVEVMNEIKQIIEKQDADVRATEQSFRKVKEGIDTSMHSIEQINRRTSELDNSRVKVVDVVQNLTAIAEENAANAEETMAFASEANDIMTEMGRDVEKLEDVAKQLMECIEMFTI